MIFIKQLVWEDWNIAHISKHTVVKSEVEEVCHGDSLERETYKNRIMLIGLTKEKRTLAVVLEPYKEEKGVYYTMSARDASRKERSEYQKERGGAI